MLETQVNKIYAEMENGRISSKKRKMVKLYESIAALLDHIISVLCTRCDNNVFAFVLGSSITNPKEVYLIKFNNSKTCFMNYNDPKKHANMTNLAKKVIRSIIGGCYDCFMKNCSTYFYFHNLNGLNRKNQHVRHDTAAL